ncbi:beta-galactosidase [Actinoplanes sp. TFC3]|uniref:beta-galactosidase n=1 Tax=Actinoplanes sp. TFC3 TaxID=1710355 RepID=UPI00082BF7C0|nr:beta-galactosidase [Actinoplanes sp. TFC3]
MKLISTKIAAAAAAAFALFSFTPAEAASAATTAAGTNATDVMSTAAAPALGIIGNYSDTDMSDLHRAGGATDVLVEMAWAQAEPVRGQYNEAYLTSIAERISRLKALGYTISFNTGVHEAPAWLLKLPGARYVDQYGQAYTDSSEPNLIFGTQYRILATRYLKKVFAKVGGDFSIVRVGGGHWGELTYPFKLDPATGKLRNLYYAFDINARKLSPTPNWKPGMPSTKGQAAKFLKFYLNSLASYQNWQVASLRSAGYKGTAAVLYPSYGMRAGDFETATATNLSGTSSPEINGEVQRGYDHARQVNALKDRNVVVYGTWAENFDTVTDLATLAKAKGLRAMAETSHVCLPSQLPTVMNQAQENNLAALYIVRLGATDIIGNARYLSVSTRR